MASRLRRHALAFLVTVTVASLVQETGSSRSSLMQSTSEDHHRHYHEQQRELEACEEVVKMPNNGDATAALPSLLPSQRCCRSLESVDAEDRCRALKDIYCNSENLTDHSHHHHHHQKEVDGKVVVDGGVWGCTYAREEAEEAAAEAEAAAKKAEAPAPVPVGAAPAPVPIGRHTERTREFEHPEPEPEPKLEDMGVWGCHYSTPVRRTVKTPDNLAATGHFRDVCSRLLEECGLHPRHCPN